MYLLAPVYTTKPALPLCSPGNYPGLTPTTAQTAASHPTTHTPLLCHGDRQPQDHLTAACKLTIVWATTPSTCRLCCHLRLFCWDPCLHHTKPIFCPPNPSVSSALLTPSSPGLPQTSSPSSTSSLPTESLLLSSPASQPHQTCAW